MCECRGLFTGIVCAAAIGSVVLLSGFTSSPQSGSKAPPKPEQGQRLKPGEQIPAPQNPNGAGEIPMPPEMAAQMEFMNPGPQQAWLAEKVGKWTFKGSMMMGPDDASEVTGKSTFEMILGGRFLVERMDSVMMDQPFQGVGTTGYNGAGNKFQMTWMDTSSTQMIIGTGNRSSDGSKLESTYDMFDPNAGKVVKLRSVETRTDADNFIFAMYAPGPDGKEAKMFEFHYSRTK